MSTPFSTTVLVDVGDVDRLADLEIPTIEGLEARDGLGRGQRAANVLSVGAALVIIGLGTKLWAARTLGSDAYYWHNFFDPDAAIGPVSTGPYRFLSSPMYTIGYLHTYGLALMLRSLPGFIAALFLQAAILAFHYLIEKPHFERLHRSS